VHFYLPFTINYIKAVGLTTDYIKVDKSRPTGTVEVNINDNNQPDYIIKKDVVWDFYNQKMY
jgi:sugar/nucleoside kinase (ribokinase family)